MAINYGKGKNDLDYDLNFTVVGPLILPLSCYANTPFFCILRNTPEYVVSRAATDRGRAIMMAWLYC